jgi:site-specific DNA recombinase
MPRAAVYARYSTDLQDGRSIDDQMALCRDHATRNGLSVTHQFEDRAKTSASIFGRDGLAALMAAAKARAFDVVLVEALDRLSRDQEDLSHIFKRLKFAGISIVTVHEGTADAVSVGLRGLMGTMFLDALKQKTRRGLAGVVRDGRSAGGKTYGYAPRPGGRNGERVVVEDEAQVIRRIFAAYVAGQCPRAIAESLNRDGILPPRGRQWNASTINGNPSRGYGILHNPIYDGRLTWNRVSMVRDPDTGRRVNRENPRDLWQETVVEDLRIVPRDLWLAAKARHRQQSDTYVNRGMTRAPLRPFSGILRCGCCGGGMGIHDRAGAAIRIRCSTATESGNCSNGGRFRLDRIEVAVFDQLRRQLDRPDYLAEFVRIYAAERRRLAADARRDGAQTERRAADAAARYNRLVDMFARGLTDGPEAEAQIMAAKAARDTALRDLDLARADQQVVELHPRAADAFAAAIGNLSTALQSPGGTLDPDSIAALRRVISTITITPQPEGDALVEVHGHIESLLGLDETIVGGALVARGRFERHPQVMAVLRVA